MNTNQHTYNYLILYLTPENLIRSNKILELQWENTRTLIPCFLKSLYTGNVEVKLHELDKVFTGIVKLERLGGRLKGNVLGKVASLWYYLTRIFHQSIGPRVGNFAEEVIDYWIKSGGIYEIIGRNITLKSAFSELGIGGVENKSRVDFALKSTSGERVVLVEIRMSEHTGGRTAQQSLLDKIDSVLKLLEEQKTLLREKLLQPKASPFRAGRRSATLLAPSLPDLIHFLTATAETLSILATSETL